MDKRFFSALLLSCIVVLLYNHFVMRPMYEKQQQAQTQIVSNDGQIAPQTTATQANQPVQTQAQQNIPTTSAISTASLLEWKQYDKEQETVLENDRVKAVFSNVGACLKSFAVKQPERPDVELVTPHSYQIQPYYMDITGASADSEVPIFQVQQVSDNIIKYTRQTASFREEKVLTLVPDSFQIDVSYTITALNDPVFLSQGIGFSLGSIEKVSQEDRREQLTASMYLNLNKGELESVKLNGKKSVTQKTGDIIWSSIKNKYFVLISKPDKENSLLDVSLLDEEQKTNVTYIRSGQQQIAKGTSATFRYLTYFGPQLLKNLVPYKSDFEKSMYFTGWFGPINLLLIKSLNGLYAFCRNYGIAIILLTIIIKLLFYPLTHKSFKSMKKMQELQPKMAVLKEKFKDDPQKMQQETMALYKREKVNPLGGCLPMLIQLPIFFGLYRTLYNAYELTDASFLWISSLSEPDKLFMFSWGGAEYPINILPLLMGITMFVQQKMSSADPQQQKMMMFMPVIFTFILYKLPSGLVLYWTLSNLLSILQQHYVKTK